MYYSFLHEEAYQRAIGASQLNHQTLKNGHVYSVTNYEPDKIQLIEKPTLPTPEKQIAKTDNIWTDSIRPGIKGAIDKVKMFVNEYMVGGSGDSNNSWFWFVVLFIFCIVLVCFLIRIQMNIDYIMHELSKTKS